MNQQALEDALRAIRGASPPGIVTTAEFEIFARSIADSALAAPPPAPKPERKEANG